MKIRLGITSVLLAAMAVNLAGPGLSWAGGKHYYPDRGYQHNKGYHHDRGYYKRHRGYKKHSYKHRHKNDDDEELLIGLLVGGLVGYAIGHSQPAQTYDYNRYPPATTLPSQDVYTSPQYDGGNHLSGCLQEREYQTTVIVGGKEVDAYGTACLQPDGSWRRGAAQLVSY